MILAETVSLDGGVLFLILVVFLVLVALWSGMVALGCFWAVRAGRGSQPALVGWVAVICLELLTGFGAGEITLLTLAGAAAIVVQVVLFLHSRRTASARPPGPEL